MIDKEKEAEEGSGRAGNCKIHYRVPVKTDSPPPIK